MPTVDAPYVLYEDNHLLAVNKPAGMATQGAAEGAASLVDWAKEYVRKKYAKPGKVYIGVVSRLDASTSGVVVLARTSKAAARLNEQFRDRHVQKTYWAVVEGRPDPEAATLADHVVKDERAQRMRVVPPTRAGAQDAQLSYRTLKTWDGLSLVEVSLETGRKHQIRLQLSERGHPIVGDRKYGSRRAFSRGIALHARRSVIEHPTKKTPLELAASLPRSWREFKLE